LETIKKLAQVGAYEVGQPVKWSALAKRKDSGQVAFILTLSQEGKSTAEIEAAVKARKAQHYLDNTVWRRGKVVYIVPKDTIPDQAAIERAIEAFSPGLRVVEGISFKRKDGDKLSWRDNPSYVVLHTHEMTDKSDGKWREVNPLKYYWPDDCALVEYLPEPEPQPKPSGAPVADYSAVHNADKPNEVPPADQQVLAVIGVLEAVYPELARLYWLKGTDPQAFKLTAQDAYYMVSLALSNLAQAMQTMQHDITGEAPGGNPYYAKVRAAVARRKVELDAYTKLCNGELVPKQ
jgi:hypothetical protein